RPAADSTRHDDGHASVHEPGAGARPESRSAERYLLAGHHVLSPALRSSAVSGRDGVRGGLSPSAYRAATAERIAARPAEVALRGRASHDGEATGGTVSDRSRVVAGVAKPRPARAAGCRRADRWRPADAGGE